VFIALESFYSMDGDAAPAQQMIASAKEILPFGNMVFVIDEAHSNGIVGPNGSGFVNHYGLEKEFAIRVQTFGKALGSTGGKEIFLRGQNIPWERIDHSTNRHFQPQC
jgi:8-amino-7-oxononanoate synthase